MTTPYKPTDADVERAKDCIVRVGGSMLHRKQRDELARAILTAHHAELARQGLVVADAGVVQAAHNRWLRKQAAKAKAPEPPR